MSEDIETFTKSKKKSHLKNGDDFPSMLTDMICGVNWKIAIFLYILMIFIFSDSYIELILTNTTGAVEGDCPTTKGTLIQISSVVLGYIILDLLVKGKFL